MDIKMYSLEPNQTYRAPKFNGQLKALEEYIENFIDDSRAMRRVTKKLQ